MEKLKIDPVSPLYAEEPRPLGCLLTTTLEGTLRMKVSLACFVFRIRRRTMHLLDSR